MSVIERNGRPILDLSGEIINEEEESMRKYFILDGFLQNNIKSSDNVYCRYREFTNLIEIYPINKKFLFEIIKLKQKLEYIPQKSGIYILECEKYIYIGQSMNLLRRIIQHYLKQGSICTQNNEITRIKQFFLIETSDRYYLERIERGYIATYSRFHPKTMINPKTISKKRR